MESKPGYKLTELGVIPEDWDVVSIGSLAAFTSGTGIRVAELHPQSSDTPVPVYGGNGLAGYTTAPLVCEPKVVVGRVGQKCGEVYLTKGPAWITDNALYPSVIFRSLDVRFLALALKAIGLNDLRNRNDLPLITQSILHSVRIPFPPAKAEQNAIASALSDADALIESLARLIAKKRQLRQGAIQELLAGRKRLRGFGASTKRFKETEVGSIPEDWDVAKLGDYLVEPPAYGINAPAVRYQDRLPTYIRITDITQDGRFSPERLVSVDAANAANYFLEEGDLVFARTGASVGKSYCYKRADGPLVFAGFLIRVRPNQIRLISSFLAAYSTSGRYWNWVRLMSMRSGQPGINGNEYARMPVPCPTIHEQNAIAAIFSDMDAEITALEAKLAKARQIKQGMMQNLLTGKIRLV